MTAFLSYWSGGQIPAAHPTRQSRLAGMLPSRFRKICPLFCFQAPMASAPEAQRPLLTALTLPLAMKGVSQYEFWLFLLGSSCDCIWPTWYLRQTPIPTQQLVLTTFVNSVCRVSFLDAGKSVFRAEVQSAKGRLRHCSHCTSSLPQRLALISLTWEGSLKGETS